MEYFEIFNEAFIFYFLNKIKCVENFQIIFRLFPKEIIVTIYGNYTLILTDKFRQLLLKNKIDPNYLNNYFKNDFIELLDILTKSNSKFLDFLNFIENKINNTIINKIYLDIINSNIKLNLNEDICQSILNYLFKHNNSDDNSSFSMKLFFLEKIGDKEEFAKSLINNLSENYFI